MKRRRFFQSIPYIGSVALAGNALAQDREVEPGSKIVTPTSERYPNWDSAGNFIRRTSDEIIEGPLEYIADSVGNQDGTVEPMEADYMNMKFERADRLYVCSMNGTEFYLYGMREIFTSLDDAIKYWNDNPNRGPTSVIEFDKTGITRAFAVGEVVVELDNVSTADYNAKMQERRDRTRQERSNR
jgi:hypothetical protein